MDQSIIEAIEKLYPKVGFQEHDGRQIAIVPAGYELKSLDGFENLPRRLEQNAHLQSLESFLEYAEAHKEPDSVIFFDEKALSARLVVDYHKSNSEPMWKGHNAFYSAELDERWSAWTAASGNYMGQIDLAEFVEKHTKDFNQPSGAEMLTIATTFQVNRKVTYGNAVNLSTGEIQFEYNNANSGAKGTMSIPDHFSLAIPVFKNGSPYSVDAKFRYRLHDENLRLQFELVNEADILRDAVSGEDGILDQLRKSGLPVYLGRI